MNVLIISQSLQPLLVLVPAKGIEVEGSGIAEQERIQQNYFQNDRDEVSICRLWLKKLIDDESAYQEQPDIECIANVHGSIEKAWLFGELHLAVRTLFMHFRKIL